MFTASQINNKTAVQRNTLSTQLTILQDPNNLFFHTFFKHCTDYSAGVLHIYNY